MTGWARWIPLLALTLTPAVASQRQPQPPTPAPRHEPAQDGLSDEPFLGPPTNASIGLGGGGPSRRVRARPTSNARRTGRRDFLENPVERSLRWLDAQLSAGAITRVEDRSLALLAMLGAGYTDHGTSGARCPADRYMKGIRSGLVSLLTGEDDEGCLSDRSAKGWLRVHAVATLALSEACWITRNPRYRGTTRRAVEFLERYRMPGGSWHDGTDETQPILTTVWATLALKSARYAGFGVDPAGFAESLSLLREHRGAATPAEEAALLLVRLLWNENPRDLAAFQRAIDAVARHAPVWGDGDTPPVDLWYFGTLAAWHAGGSTWKRWNESMAGSIPCRQRDAGDLAGSWPVGEGPAVVAEQAKLAMCLEVYYRYDRVFGVK